MQRMPFPFYKQTDSMDCGPTCLRKVAKHYKRNGLLKMKIEATPTFFVNGHQLPSVYKIEDVKYLLT